MPKKRTGKHFGQARVQRKKRSRRIKIYILLGGIILALFVLIYATFNANFFKIKSFIVKTSADTNHEKLIKDLRLLIAKTPTGAIFGTNHYLSWPNAIENPPIEFSAIDISKSIFNKEITIKATPRVKYGLWCTERPNQNPEFALATCYWIDSGGIIFKEGPIANGQMVPVLYEKNGLPLKPSKKPIIDPTTFEIIKNIIAGLAAMDLSYQKIDLQRLNQEIEINLNSGPVVHFSLRFDPVKTALPALAKLNNDGRLSKMRYLDLTVQNRAFYKND